MLIMELIILLIDGIILTITSKSISIEESELISLSLFRIVIDKDKYSTIKMTKIISTKYFGRPLYVWALDNVLE